MHGIGQFKFGKIKTVSKSGFWKWIWHFQTGSPAIHGDSEEDGVSDDVAVDAHYSETQSEKQKISERMLSWRVNHSGESINAPKYDKEVPRNHIPLLTNGTDVSFNVHYILL